MIYIAGIYVMYFTSLQMLAGNYDVTFHDDFAPKYSAVTVVRGSENKCCHFGTHLKESLGTQRVNFILFYSIKFY